MTNQNQTFKYSAFLENETFAKNMKLWTEGKQMKDGMLMRMTGDTSLIALSLLGEFASGLHEYITNGIEDTIVLLRVDERDLMQRGSVALSQGVPLVQEMERIGQMVIDLCPEYLTDAVGVAYSVYKEETRGKAGSTVLDIRTTVPCVKRYTPLNVQQFNTGYLNKG